MRIASIPALHQFLKARGRTCIYIEGRTLDANVDAPDQLTVHLAAAADVSEQAICGRTVFFAPVDRETHEARCRSADSRRTGVPRLADVHRLALGLRLREFQQQCDYSRGVATVEKPLRVIDLHLRDGVSRGEAFVDLLAEALA